MFLVPWLWAGRRAQGLTEYGLILALISIAAILALAFLGTAIGSLISNTTSLMDHVNNP
jgi:Flp pilus assembly pilin Flp